MGFQYYMVVAEFVVLVGFNRIKSDTMGSDLQKLDQQELDSLELGSLIFTLCILGDIHNEMLS